MYWVFIDGVSKFRAAIHSFMGSVPSIPFPILVGISIQVEMLSYTDVIYIEGNIVCSDPSAVLILSGLVRCAAGPIS